MTFRLWVESLEYRTMPYPCLCHLCLKLNMEWFIGGNTERDLLHKFTPTFKPKHIFCTCLPSVCFVGIKSVPFRNELLLRFGTGSWSMEWRQTYSSIHFELELAKGITFFYQGRTFTKELFRALQQVNISWGLWALGLDLGKTDINTKQSGIFTRLELKLQGIAAVRIGQDLKRPPRGSSWFCEICDLGWELRII